LRLIVEVDGEMHSLEEQKDYDKKRDKIPNLNGYYIIRLSNFEIESDTDSAVNKIKSYITTNLSPSQGNHRVSGI
jgi:very-short-patch-repair endonuclease